MIAIDTKNPVELRMAGIRLLNEGLGVDGARIFINQYFGGRGDYTAEKQTRPPKSDAELERLEELFKAEAEAAGIFE